MNKSDNGDDSSTTTVTATVPATATATATATTINADSDKVQQQLAECDRLQLQFLGSIQGGGAGNSLFISYPEGKIVAADEKIRTSLPWIKEQQQHTAQSSSSSFHAVADPPRDAGEGLVEVMCDSSCSSDSGSEDHQESSYRQQQERRTAKALLNADIQTWIPPGLHKLIISGIEEMVKDKSRRSFRFFQHEQEAYAISISPIDAATFATIGIEIERLADHASSPGDFYKTLISVSRIMERYADEQVVAACCDTVYNLLGSYDRAMVYRFNDDYSGEVIHEIKNEKAAVRSSFLGTRFPAGDIPLSARKLYITNGLRYIYDSSAEDVKIVKATDERLDLSHIRMRACAKQHIMYLQNMGVRSSMSIAIVVEGKLWGLLGFHSYDKAFKPCLHQRIACETITSMLSVKMEALMKKSQSNQIIKLSEVMLQWEQDQSLTTNFQSLGKDILSIVGADILVGRIQDPAKEEPDTVVIGDATLAPGTKFWKAVATQPKRELCTSITRADISAKLGLTETDCPASGIAYYGDGLIEIMLGRGLRSKDVMWGGRPNEPKERNEEGMLCPRSSFAKYMEKAKKESRAWSKIDMHVMTALTERASEYSHHRMIALLKSDIDEANTKHFNAIEKVRDNCEFFAQMSHEIRTPFHGVMGCLTILEDATNMAPHEVQDMVDTALSSGNHMIHLLNDILDISKNEYTSRAIATDKISYQALASEAASSLKSLAMNNGIAFHTTIHVPADGNTLIVTDRTKVVQVVSNIVNNAVKFSADGSIDVEIKLVDSIKTAVLEVEKVSNEREGTVFAMKENLIFDSIDQVRQHVLTKEIFKSAAANERWILVSVADSGCGMDPTSLAEMLKPYTQASNGSNRKFQGTGLGLFICLSLCQQLNGFIACSSTEGVGSTFHVGIPVGIPTKASGSSDTAAAAMEVDVGCSAAAASSSIAYEEAVEPFKIEINGPIAVVDDNKVNVKILVRSLKNECKKAGMADIELITADGGMEAFELYKARRPCVLCIDYHMPGVDGLEATQMIRKYEAEHNLRRCFILSYTADATETTAEILLANGTDAMMTKPPPKAFLPTLVGRFQTTEVASAASTSHPEESGKRTFQDIST